jgi:hypothetical protein
MRITLRSPVLRSSLIRATLSGLSLCLAVSFASSAAAQMMPVPRVPKVPMQHPAPPKLLLAFGAMYGVDAGFVGSANPIRGGIPGDDLPWDIDRAHGFLMSNGHLVIDVRGLVFANDPSVPPDIVGTNDETQFRGMVSCLIENDNGTVGEVHVISPGFPATTTGNSRINAMLDIPSTCIAPIVFVLAGSEDAWFATTGFEGPSS